MKIVIAFTPMKLRSEVRAVGEQVGAEFADVSGSDTAYGELIARLWKAGQAFTLIEHDVVPTVGLLEEMTSCDSEWCAGFAWRYSGPVDFDHGETKPRHPIREKEVALFCHRFSADLLRRTPNVAIAAAVRWTQVDLALLGLLAQQGATPHLHEPAVQHLHQQHPAWAATMTEEDWANV